jgi:hypothetical protein
MTLIYQLDLSPLEVGQRNKKELDKTTKFSHDTLIHPKNPILPPKFSQQCRCSLPNIDDLIVTLKNFENPKHN